MPRGDNSHDFVYTVFKCGCCSTFKKNSVYHINLNLFVKNILKIENNNYLREKNAATIQKAKKISKIAIQHNLLCNNSCTIESIT